MFDRDEQEISQIIETGLKAIQSGQATLEQVLSQHPEQAEQIRPELEAAMWLMARRGEVSPRARYLAASRQRVLARIRSEAAGQGAKHAFFGFAWPKRFTFQWVAAAVVILVLLTGTSTLVSASQSSLPGDNLYAVKRISEQVAYTVTLNDVQRVELSAQLAERRLEEVEQLMAAGNYSAVEVTLDEFNEQANQAVALLEKVSNSQAAEKISAAIALKQNFAREAAILRGLQAKAPADLRGHILEALEITNDNNTATDIVIRETPGATLTLTLTPIVSTPTVTETPVPPSPTVPSPTAEEFIPSSSTPEPVVPSLSKQPTPTPTDPAKPTHKPKPVNDNSNPPKNDNKPPKNDPPGSDNKNK